MGLWNGGLTITTEAFFATPQHHEAARENEQVPYGISEPVLERVSGERVLTMTDVVDLIVAV